MRPIDLSKFPALNALIKLVDEHLIAEYPDYFGPMASHPVLRLKRSKVIHDTLWGTNEFSWQELAVIDSPVLQRLRGIHQTGLAFQIYPCAHHTRFEHSLGVATVATRVFESLLKRSRGRFLDCINAYSKANGDTRDVNVVIGKLRLELRLAALLHDTGHSLFSHSSEQVFKSLVPISEASDELAKLVAKEKGAAEALAVAIALSPCVGATIERAASKLMPANEIEGYSGPIDMTHVALLILGRSKHPFLQFLADIISSGFDADKLDYLLRDATCAGLPLRYDFERYFYSVRLEEDVLADGERKLRSLFEMSNATAPERRPARPGRSYEHYDTYRLRLPVTAMNTIEQIVICKLMLFSYIYHHPKVRAAEGALIDVLHYAVAQLRSAGRSDTEIVRRFLRMTDDALSHPNALTDGLPEPAANYIQQVCDRIANRALPREVYRIGGAVAFGAEVAFLRDFLTTLQDRQKRQLEINRITQLAGQRLVTERPNNWSNPDEAVRATGLRIDVPKAPQFEDVDELVVKGEGTFEEVQLLQVFPIGQWTQAYTHYRYYVRVFCHSEHVDLVRDTVKAALKEVLGIKSDEFYKKIERQRH